MPEHPSPYSGRLHQPRQAGSKPTPRVVEEGNGEESEPDWNAGYNGPAPKLLFVAPNGEIYELDKGQFPNEFGDKAILGGLIGAVTNHIQEQWLRG